MGGEADDPRSLSGTVEEVTVKAENLSGSADESKDNVDTLEVNSWAVKKCLYNAKDGLTVQVSSGWKDLPDEEQSENITILISKETAESLINGTSLPCHTKGEIPVMILKNGGGLPVGAIGAPELRGGLTKLVEGKNNTLKSDVSKAKKFIGYLDIAMEERVPEPLKEEVIGRLPDVPQQKKLKEFQNENLKMGREGDGRNQYFAKKWFVDQKMQLPKDVHVDHVVPYSKGGAHTSANACLLTGETNRKKHNSFTLEWALCAGGTHAASKAIAESANKGNENYGKYTGGVPAPETFSYPMDLIKDNDGKSITRNMKIFHDIYKRYPKEGVPLKKDKTKDKRYNTERPLAKDGTVDKRFTAASAVRGEVKQKEAVKDKKTGEKTSKGQDIFVSPKGKLYHVTDGNNKSYHTSPAKQPTDLGTSPKGHQLYKGEKGGIYHESASGKKVYHKAPSPKTTALATPSPAYSSSSSGSLGFSPKGHALQAGSQGGIFHYSRSGNKVYHRR